MENEFVNLEGELDLPHFKQETESTLVMAFVGEVSSGKSSAIKNIFNVDPGNISPIPGSTTGLKYIKLHQDVLLLDTPGLQDIQQEHSELAKSAYNLIDLFIITINGQGGVKSTNFEMVKNIEPFQKPVLILITKLDTLHPQDREPLIQHSKEILKPFTDNVIGVMLDPDLRLIKSEPELLKLKGDSIAKVLDWLRSQLDNPNKNLHLEKIITTYRDRAWILVQEYLSGVKFFDHVTNITEKSLKKHATEIINRISNELGEELSQVEVDEIILNAFIDWNQIAKKKRFHSLILLLGGFTGIFHLTRTYYFRSKAVITASGLLTAEYLSSKKKDSINDLMEKIKEEVVLRLLSEMEKKK